MSDDLSRALIREVVRELPEALDQGFLEVLATKLRPYLRASVDAEPPGEQLMTPAEAAARARVHVETVRRAIRAGELPIAGRVGRSPRISKTELDRWLAEASEADETIRRSAARRSPSRRRHDSEYSLKAVLRDLPPRVAP